MADNETSSETAVSETAVSEPVPEGYRGPRIVINPTTFKNKKDALCVAFNEAFRVVMEDMSFSPVSEPTDRQRRFFSDTAYANDEEQLRRTILARICTFDTSVKDPTDEQLQEAMEFLESVMEEGYPQNEWEQSSVQRIHDVVAKAVGAPRAGGEEEVSAKAEERTAGEPPTRADVGGGDAAGREEELETVQTDDEPRYTADGQAMEEGRVYVDYAKSVSAGGGGLTDDPGGLLGEFRREDGESPDTGFSPLDPGELRKTFRATSKRKNGLAGMF